jgi:arylsulfatase A-like enzyme
VLLSIDSMRHDFLGSAGDPSGLSPVLDRLARDGVLFSEAISTTCWTLPAHMSLLTGQYVESHGVIGDGHALPEEKVTLAEFLASHGYRTAGFVSGPYLHPAYGFAQGFHTYERCVSYGEKVGEKGKIENVIAVNIRSHMGVTGPRLHEHVMRWLDTVPEGRPYFLFVHYWDPHYDYEPPFPWDRFLDPDYRGKITGHGVLQDPRIHVGMPARDRRRLLDLYRGEIRYTDGWIGKLVERLRERGELDRTLFVVVADHGEEFFEHGRIGHRHNLYQETLRIPMIVRFPGLFEGGKILRRPVSLVDVFPTVCALLGSERPAELQGVDLGAVLRGEVGRRPLFAQLRRNLLAVRVGDWKLHWNRDSDERELYRLPEDPGELFDRSVQRPELADRLEALLREGGYARFAPGATPRPEIDRATEEALRALGYTD